MDRSTKLRPTYSLADIQAQMTTVKAMYPTRSALRDIRAAEMSLEDALTVIRSLAGRCFYKSMPCYIDRRVWQDVYYTDWCGLPLYVKFQKGPTYFFVVSFKERDDQ